MGNVGRLGWVLPPALLSRNATSYGVIVAVYTSAIPMIKSQRFINLDRGSRRYGDCSYFAVSSASLATPSAS